MYKIVETITLWNSPKGKTYDSKFRIKFKNFWGWHILTRKEINEKELIFDSYNEAEDYLKNSLGSHDELVKEGNTYKFEYYTQMMF